MNVRRLKNIVTKKITKEIPSSLKYHGLHHTLDVYNACNAYIKRLNIDPYDAYLLRSAALTHDIGILYTYTGHEEEGMKYVKEKLPELGYTKREINKICNLIKATQLPQEPKNLLEEILCDSDLDYIGTDKFYEIGNTLFD
jgi:HD superfamily phosphodiesterase